MTVYLILMFAYVSLNVMSKTFKSSQKSNRRWDSTKLIHNQKLILMESLFKIILSHVLKNCMFKNRGRIFCGSVRF